MEKTSLASSVSEFTLQMLDNHVLECVSSPKTEFVLTGDRHLLKIGRVQVYQNSEGSRFSENVCEPGSVPQPNRKMNSKKAKVMSTKEPRGIAINRFGKVSH